jgi:hypothetical protein
MFRLILSALFCLLLTSPAYADPIVLTSGHATVIQLVPTRNGRLSSVSGAGAGLSFTASNSDECVPPSNCGPINSIFISTTFQPFSTGSGTLTYLGVSYPWFHVSAGIGDEVLSGTITVRDMFLGGSTLFTIDFIGYGHSALTETPDFRRLDFVVTPEPPSIALLTGPVLFLLWRIRRKVLTRLYKSQ